MNKDTVKDMLEYIYKCIKRYHKYIHEVNQFNIRQIKQ